MFTSYVRREGHLYEVYLDASYLRTGVKGCSKIRRVLAKSRLILDQMCRLYGKFASYFSSYKWPHCSLRERSSWFATTWHVGGQYNIIFSQRFTWNPEEGNAFVLDHQHGRRHVTCKQAILSHWRIKCFSIYVLGKVGKVENCDTVEPSCATTSYENQLSKTPNNLYLIQGLSDLYVRSLYYPT